MSNTNIGFNRANDHWGKHLWAFLHTMTVCDFSFLEANLRTQKPIVTNIKMLTSVIPCPECKAHFLQHLSSIDDIDLYKSNSLFYWTIDFHNKVNERLGKPVLSYAEAEAIWCHKIDD